MSLFRCFIRGSSARLMTTYDADINPPQSEAAPEPIRSHDLHHEASPQPRQSAIEFRYNDPLNKATRLSFQDEESVRQHGSRAWTFKSAAHFPGQIYQMQHDSGITVVATDERCQDTCIFSNLPIIAGLYDFRHSRGVYYEVEIRQMTGVIAIGTARKPHPMWRLPRWKEHSAGLHLDDRRKFFEDLKRGRKYALTSVKEGDVIGCGYSFDDRAIFFTHNGRMLDDAFTGLYSPHDMQDVYAAIGMQGHSKLKVNFGGSPFVWQKGNQYEWKLETHIRTDPPPYR